MSITLGNYFVETKKTVGALPAGSDDILAETPCEEVIEDSTVQPVWKKIHQYSFNRNSSPIVGGHELLGWFNIPDDLFADGYDYRVTIDNITYTGGTMTQVVNRFSYNYLGLNWFHNIINGTQIIMNENNCGGSYANTQRVFFIYSLSATLFNLKIDWSIEQLIPATIEIELCGGGTTTNLTELKEISEVINVMIEDGIVIEVNGRSVPVISTKRQTPYDPYSGGFSEIAKLPKTCLGYGVHYVASLFSSPYTSPNDKTYWVASGVYEAKINIPKVPPQILDFKLYNGSSYIFDQASDADGLIDWTPFTLGVSGVNTSLELWEPILNVQETSSAEQYVYFKYDLASYDCPCSDCGSDCGEITVIFHQNCGTSYPLKFNLMIQEGGYPMESEETTQGNRIITPIVKKWAVYDFVISEYSDETFLLLQDLIADNISIEVVDNIDTGNPTTEYFIDKQGFKPDWNFNSKLGSVTIPVKKANSIRTSRRNCCN